MRIVKWTLWLTLVAAVLLLAVSNMQPIEVVIDPFALQLDALAPLVMPLSLLVLLSVGVGLFLGVVLEHFRGRHVRRRLRESKREAGALKSENDQMHAAMKKSDHPDSAGLPVRRA